MTTSKERPVKLGAAALGAQHLPAKPSRAEVEAAFRTIIRWTGDDPDRDGLAETPARVTRAFEEYFSDRKSVV